MLFKYWVLVAIAFFSTIASAVPAPITDVEAQTGLREHRKRIARFKCSTPQPRSYKIKDLLPVGAIDTNEIIFPAFTVIRTCDGGSGCCEGEDNICALATNDGFESDEVMVKISKLVGDNNPRYSVLQIQHHKKCECKLRSEYAPSPPTAALVNLQ